MISLDTARQLLDFAGGGDGAPARVSSERAEEQLEGAVAIHNILEGHRVAYLADEVGMGKTYVALGAFALFRHFDPRFRILVIAPKANIQQKWIKDLRNFVRNNVRFADLRIKAIHGAPARAPVLCESLLDLIRQTAADPDRDFFARLSSFSFGLGEDPSDWGKKRDELLKALPWLDAAALDLRRKDAFKESFARATCCALPDFDLVIVDEAHNLKAGLGSKAWRNRLLALALGVEPANAGAARAFRGYGRRARRVLLLSATPLEDDYRHVWNQLSVFGMQEAAAGLDDPERSDGEKREVLSRFLVRRVNVVRVRGQRLTKNLYRREWRAGGVEQHDEPLRTPDQRQQLIVALVQKKVSELLASPRFNHSFQIGMLASFESFLHTAKVRREDDPAFDDIEQTEDLAEREGIDVGEVNRLAASYRRHFGRELPHPKMDGLVRALRDVFASGEKALVFVRRIASVTELQRKLEAEYDEWLFARLRTVLRPELRQQMEGLFDRYREERRTGKSRPGPADEVGGVDLDLDDDEQPVRGEQEDRGGNETFFAWFFRGEGPRGVLSGAQLSFRLNTPHYALSSFFLDNWVASLLGAEPGRVFDALQQALGADAETLRRDLELLAGSVVRVRSRNRHRELFLAFQLAALELLRRSGSEWSAAAAVALRQLAAMRTVADRSIPLGGWLETATFFTELRRRHDLRNELWPEETRGEREAAFRRRELRRELISSMFRLGHPLVDLWGVYVDQVQRLDSRAAEREGHDGMALAAALLDLLEAQRKSEGFTAWRELRDAAEHFDLIVDINAPALWERKLAELPNEMGKLLRQQQPIGGMFGTVNGTLVRQFRMPGYPLVLITTDLLQEGEDLHLFCSRVYHYGISWMPSSMEQRIGRVDRVRSQTERRLLRPNTIAEGEAGDAERLLQVFYPYLPETVEVFQVERVFERLNRFMRLMHEGFGGREDDCERKVDVRYEAQRSRRDVAAVTEPLRSAFPVRPDLVNGAKGALAVDPRSEQRIRQRFRRLATLEDLGSEKRVEWQRRDEGSSLIGTLRGLADGRRQPFTLLLHSIDGRLNVRCVSPVGRVDPRAAPQRISDAARSLPVRLGAVYDARFQRYDLTAEGDVLLGTESSDRERVRWLVDTVVTAADRLEQALLGPDQDPAPFHEDLAREAEFER